MATGQSNYLHVPLVQFWRQSGSSRTFTRGPLSSASLKDSIQKVNPENMLERDPGAFRSICSKLMVCHLVGGNNFMKRLLTHGCQWTAILIFGVLIDGRNR